MNGHLRRRLGTQPRWMLAVLLAFAIETLPPPAALVAHRHAGGGVAHTHAGPVTGAVATASESSWAQAVRTAGSGIARAATDGLHHHVVPVVVAVRGPAAMPPGPHLLASDVPSTPVPAERTAVVPRGQARSPPVLDA